MSSGGKPTVHGFAIFFRIRPMLGRMSTAVGKRIRADAEPDRRGTVKVAVGDWAVCLQAAHPGYISWEEFMTNQRRLADNVNHYEAGHTGAPRKGAALLQGIAICGRCGRRMSLHRTRTRSLRPFSGEF